MESLEFIVPSHLILKQKILCWKYSYNSQFCKWKLANLFRKSME